MSGPRGPRPPRATSYDDTPVNGAGVPSEGLTAPADAEPDSVLPPAKGDSDTGGRVLEDVEPPPDALLHVRGLKVHFPLRRGLFPRLVGHVKAVDGVTFWVRRGETLGLVGESGSGKTTVGTSLLNYSRAGAFISSGKVLLEGRDVLGMPWQEVRKIRGEEIAYVPQDPASALNPAIRIGKQIVELMQLRNIGTAESRMQGARAGLEEVGLPSDDEFLSRYAHQLSGGQVQRVALAMAFLP